MLRETAKRHGTLQTAQQRSGEILALNGNGTYTVRVGGTQYEGVSTATGTFHRAGESVRIQFLDGQPVIIGA